MKNIIVTGVKGKLSCKTANWLKSKSNFKVEQLSLRGDFENCDFTKIDSIVHIAGVTPQNIKDENDYINVNYLLTKELAEKAKKEGVKQFVYISSMSVYGIEQNLISQKGEINKDTPCHPVSEYGRSKLKAEEHLTTLCSENFKVCVIRAPSIYDSEKTEYIDQYKYLADKYPFIPNAFKKNYKSFIHSDNLCELISLVLDSDCNGIVCPDDGKISAFDICHTIYPQKPVLRIPGILIELFMKRNPRIIDYYGAVYYSDCLTNTFNGEYRVTNARDAIKNLYEKSN